MAEIAFVDTHVHFSDLQHPTLRYAWLEPGVRHHVLGDIEAIKTQRYWADDFLAEVRFANVSKSVHVQAAQGNDDPVEETRWLQAFADRLGHPHGIVVRAYLARPDAQATLERHMAFPNMRGVRDFGEGDYLLDPAWQRGYALLGAHDLVYCVDPDPERFGQMRALADRHPSVVLSLDHAGSPRRRDAEYFAWWRQGLATLAGAPNVVVKVSSLGGCDPRWTVDSFRPWVLACIEAFGVERTYFGTDWPVDRMSSSYPDVVDAYATIIGDFTRPEQEALFHGNAERIYRI